MSTTHDAQVARYTEEYRGPVTADAAAADQSAEAASDQKSEMQELITLLRAHVEFARKVLEFTDSALAEIRRNLAG